MTFSTKPSSNNSHIEFVIPPSTKLALMPSLIIASRMKRVAAREAPPVPVWNENPSL